MAKLYFRYGAMNSGKSTNLIQTAHNYHERGMAVFTIKAAIDTKGDNQIVSRIGAHVHVDALVSKTDDLFELIFYKNRKKDIHCLLVDEVQFLEPEQIDQLLKIATVLNIPVICYGLRTDFQTKGFPGSTRLLQLAHSIEELKTICRCSKKAIFNMRFVNDKPVWSGDSVVIDDNSIITYESMCATCAHKHELRAKEHATHSLFIDDTAFLGQPQDLPKWATSHKEPTDSIILQSVDQLADTCRSPRTEVRGLF